MRAEPLVDGRRLLGGLLPVALSALAAFLVVSPPSSIGVAVVIGLGVLLTVMLPPHLFMAASLLALGTFQLSTNSPIEIGPFTAFSTDIMLLLLLMRALLPRERLPSTHPLGRGVVLCAGLWAVVMAAAAIRGVYLATPIETIFRLEMVLIYVPIYYLSFSRVLRETTLDREQLFRALAVVAVGLVAWMILMRILGNPFEDVNQLGRVITSEGVTLRRDYGFASAFIVFPALALAALACVTYGRLPSRWAAALTAIGTGATLLTLIRGEIYGLMLGIVVVLALRSQGFRVRSRRVRSVVQLGGAFVGTLILLSFVDPSLGQGVAERSLPGLEQQSFYAQGTAEYRVRALDTGIAVAEKKPFGLGLVTEETLSQKGVQPGYPGHSAVAWLLVYVGWPGLITALLSVGAIAWRSFRVHAAEPWLHPAFLGIIAMLLAYSLTANGLVGQAWVIGLGALTLALRFGLPREEVAR